MTNEWRAHSRALAAQLDALGVLEPGWRTAFEDVPRHLFVPRFYRYPDNALVSSAEPDLRGEWLDGVYSDESLVTQRAQAPDADLTFPTSSSTRPSLMARMLQLLGAQPGQRVLEIGTGTGYNAALLCYHLGDTHVASIDIDPSLVAIARERLAVLGYHPHLTSGDGSLGMPEHAPYDRIIATCAVPAIPSAWISQLHRAGRIVTDIRGELTSSLVVLDRVAVDTVVGRFLAEPGHFMWLRAAVGNPLRDGGTLIRDRDHTNSTTRPSSLDPAILDDPGFRFVVQLDEPHITAPGTISYDHGPEKLYIRAGESWAELDSSGTVTEGGPRRVWAQIERTAATWDKHGRPDRERFGITASTHWPARYWIDEPDNDWR
ncbi:methyltransferase domain-containing protein [Longispora albida]|uniref:methyltransferase domain-containing protein n=1 Tax=Longispora albida TaxID=203523 RepID=UPI0003647402|nr:methyltransferase domain-containing protein [Longispora albida]